MHASHSMLGPALHCRRAAEESAIPRNCKMILYVWQCKVQCRLCIWMRWTRGLGRCNAGKLLSAAIRAGTEPDGRMHARTRRPALAQPGLPGDDGGVQALRRGALLRG